MIKKNNIGILGGSFDPVHFGHLSIARIAFHHFNLDKVLFIPAGIPPHKTGTSSSYHRMAMLKIATEDNESFCLWNEEVEREGLSYTVDTVKKLTGHNPDSRFFFIMGSDNLKDILSWRDYKTIISMVTLCITHRPGYSMKIPDELSGTKVMEFPSPECDISSTEIRSFLARDISCRYLIPEQVIKYIKNNSLYTK